jgi:hypothetical protein
LAEVSRSEKIHNFSKANVKGWVFLQNISYLLSEIYDEVALENFFFIKFIATDMCEQSNGCQLWLSCVGNLGYLIREGVWERPQPMRSSVCGKYVWILQRIFIQFFCFM